MSGSRDDRARVDPFEREALPYLDAVFRFAMSLTGSPDAASDLTQETFLRAFRSWEKYAPGTRCKSWLFTICRNRFLEIRARRTRFEEIVSEQAETGGEDESVSPVWRSVSCDDPEGEFFTSLVDDSILEAIDDLSEELRAVLVLSDVEGLPYAEIARLMGIPRGTVKSRLFRARRRLQEVLYDYAAEMGYVMSTRPGADRTDERG